MVKYVEIPLDKLKDGMVVGKSIEDRLGRHLIESGTIINRYAIIELANYGIKTVLIKVENHSKTSLSPAAELAVKELRRADPSTVILKTTVKKRISEGIEYIYQNPDKGEIAKAASKITDDLLNAIESNNAVALNINAL